MRISVVGEQTRQLDDAGAVIGDHHVRLLFHRRQGVGDGDGAAAGAQEGLIVLGIADAHDIVQRQAQRLERALEPPGLVDIARQHHHRALVEDNVQLKGELADGLQHSFLVRLPGGDDGAADRQRRDAEFLQAGDKSGRGWLGERRFLLLGRVEQEGAILGDDKVEQVEFRKDALQVGKIPAGDEDQLPAGSPHLLQGLDGRRIDSAVAGERAVVVRCQGDKEHRKPSAQWALSKVDCSASMGTPESARQFRDSCRLSRACHASLSRQ